MQLRNAYGARRGSDVSNDESLPRQRGARTTPLDDLENVVALYQPRVFRFLLAQLRDRDAAETLTQETFLRAWSARASFREDCSVATWLIRIALNLARDHTRTGRFRFWKRVSASAVDVAEVAAIVPAREGSAEERPDRAAAGTRYGQTVASLSSRAAHHLPAALSGRDGDYRNCRGHRAARGPSRAICTARWPSFARNTTVPRRAAHAQLTSAQHRISLRRRYDS